MQYITFRIDEDKIKVLGKSGEAGSHKTRAIFRFGAGWSGKKVATFRNLSSTENILLENDACDIPDRFLSGRYSVKITSRTRKTDFVIVEG